MIGAPKINYTDIETSGSIELIQDSSGYAYVRDQSGDIDGITHGGKQVGNNQWRGWTIEAAETVNGVNQVVWQHKRSGRMSVWDTDGDWNFVRDAWKGYSSFDAVRNHESTFQKDFNGDGVIPALQQEQQSFI